MQDETSMIVRCIDAQRKNNFLQGYEKKAPSTRYLIGSQKSNLKYKVIEDGFFTSYEPLTELMPSSYVK